MTTTSLIFLLLVVYQLKHFIADYPLQNTYMLGKFKPGWDFLGPLLSHVSVHFSFTTLISATVLAYFNHPAPFGFGMLIGFGDGLVHFTMDRIKAGPKYMGRWKPLTTSEWMKWNGALTCVPGDTWKDSEGHEMMYNYDIVLNAPWKLRGNRLFWICLGLDQAIHHLTDYAAIYAVLKIAGAL